MAGTSGKGGRSRGHIRRRGRSFQVLVYAGIDSDGDAEEDG